MRRVFMALFVVASVAATAQAQMRITEWMYDGKIGEKGNYKGEFVEFTNVGFSAIDMTGWSFDDIIPIPGTVDLSAFGTIAAGESVILTDASITDFRAAWALPATVKIIGDNTANLGRDDEINLFDATGARIDYLTFSDQTFPGTIRTQKISGNPISPNELGAHNVAGWTLSFVGDTYGSYANNVGDIGNPGHYAVPEPTSIILVLIGFASLIGLRRNWS
jgi:predicted extracellular nuclease